MLTKHARMKPRFHTYSTRSNKNKTVHFFYSTLIEYSITIHVCVQYYIIQHIRILEDIRTYNTLIVQ